MLHESRVIDTEMIDTRSDATWAAIQPWDVARFGETILDHREQERWSRAIFLGGLTYMWREAGVVRELIYDRLELRRGDRVLVLGEAIEPSGFVADLQSRVGAEGRIHVVEVIDEARDRVFGGVRGKDGQLGTWHYDYTSEVPDEFFDCVAVLQGVQHAEDWHETGQELLRIMKPGRNIVLGEIAFGPNFARRVAADVHIEYVMEKLFSRVGPHYTELAYHGPRDLLMAFDDLVNEPEVFEWRGIELFWGRKR